MHEKEVVGDLPARLERNIGRDVRLGTTSLVVRPALGEVELAIDKNATAARRVDEVHAHLAVLGLAEPAAPLARDTDRVLTALREGGAVDDDDAIRGADLLNDVRAHLGTRSLVGPLAGTDEVLERPAIEAVGSRDRLDRLTFEIPEEALDVHLHVASLLLAVDQRRIALKKRIELIDAASNLRPADESVSRHDLLGCRLHPCPPSEVLGRGDTLAVNEATFRIVLRLTDRHCSGITQPH